MFDMRFPLVVLLLLCCAAALVNWRHAVLLTIVLDALRDPFRKITPDQPVWMSQSIAVVWVVIFVCCLMQSPGLVASVRKLFPRSREGTFFLLAGLMPGAIISLVMYRNGWILALIGLLSYVGPLLGLLIGIAFAQRTLDVQQFMRLFVLVNCPVMLGSVAEHLGWSWPGLGGLIGFEWIRHMPGVLVRMVSGWFRSPDIAGFHAAHTLIFCLILSMPKNSRDVPRPYWLVPGLFSLYVLFIAGRRKMFSIPAIFLLSWVVVDLLRRRKGSTRLIFSVGMSLLVLVGVGFYFIRDDENLDHHQVYMATTLYDIAPKLYEHSFQGSVTTISQSGIMGSGLGVATQGAQYSGVDRTKVWQEDGVSRLFKELGVVGVLLLAFSLWQYFFEFRRAFRLQLRDPLRQLLQNAGVAIFFANAACFAVSHQHISGDVANGVLPLLFLGGVLGHVIAERRSIENSGKPGILPQRSLS